MALLGGSVEEQNDLHDGGLIARVKEDWTMITRSQDKKLVPLALAALSLFILGCTLSECPLVMKLARYWRSRAHAVPGKQQIAYQGPLDAAAKGRPSVDLRLEQLFPDCALVFSRGTYQFSGRLTAETAGAVLPKKLRFQTVSHKAGGQTIATRYYDVTVQSDGTIPLQSFAYSKLDMINYGESADLTIIPVDAPLPACTSNLTVTFLPGKASAVDPTLEEDPGLTEDSSLPNVTKLQATFSDYTWGGPKGKVLGHLLLIPIKGRMLSVNGKVVLKGKLTRDSATKPFPSKIKGIVKHLDSKGTLLSTDTFMVTVQPDGTIRSQAFRVSTLKSGVKESLDLYFMFVDKDLPPGTIEVTAVFTAS